MNYHDDLKYAHVMGVKTRGNLNLEFHYVLLIRDPQKSDQRYSSCFLQLFFDFQRLTQNGQWLNYICLILN